MHRLDESIRGLDTNMHGLDESMRGLDTNMHGLDENMRGLDESMHKLDKSMCEIDDSMRRLDKNPFLFIIKVNDIITCSETFNFILFADVTFIYSTQLKMQMTV